MQRQIGPVTTTTATVAAIVTVICMIVEQYFKVTIEAGVEGLLTMIAVYIAGWCVSPKQALARARMELFQDMQDNARSYTPQNVDESE